MSAAPNSEKTAWTPGPWEWDLYARGYVLVGAAPEWSSVRQPVRYSHSSPDGCLIAASPDLYEALDQLAVSVDGLNDAFADQIRKVIGSTNYDLLMSHLEDGETALAKARGEQP